MQTQMQKPMMQRSVPVRKGSRTGVARKFGTHLAWKIEIFYGTDKTTEARRSYRRAAPPSLSRHMVTRFDLFFVFFSPVEERLLQVLPHRARTDVAASSTFLLVVVVVVFFFVFVFVARVFVCQSQLWVPLSIRPSLGSTPRPSLLGSSPRNE